MRLTRRQSLIGIAALSLTPGGALAHRENATRTIMAWNGAGSILEITHSYHLHDVATTLSEHGFLEKPDLLSLKQRARLALYTEAHFRLFSGDNTAIKLSLLGADISGREVLVYQQAKLSHVPKALAVDCRLLRSLIPDQCNHVDWQLGHKVVSETFAKNDGIKMMLA